LGKYLISYDLGTNGVKAALFSPEGQQIAYCYHEYGVIYPRPSWVEQSIETMWTAQCEVTHQLIYQSGCNYRDIAAVAISSQRATFAPLDQFGNPLADFIGWQDSRSIKQCEHIQLTIGTRRYYEISGLPVSTTAALSKILWIKENDPGLFERTATFGSTQSVHLHQLGVENPPCDLADAGYMGLLDVDQLSWSRDLLDKLGIPLDKMPRLANSGERVGEISAQAAAAIGLAVGTPVVTAGGDLQCGGAGLGIVKPGTVSLGIGSGGGILIYLDKPLRHPEIGLNCQPHVVQGSWEMEGICLASGASFKWYRDVLSQMEKETANQKGLDAYDLLNEAAALSAPGAGGVLFMPALAGAGAPYWYPQARGVLLGLTLATNKKDINRAILEGICLEMRAMVEAARRLGIQIDELRIWGGAAKSDFWNQISVNVYGLPAVKTAIHEAGLAGAAICAGVGIGLYSNVGEGAENFVRIEKRFEPDPTVRSRYDEMFDLYQTIYKALKDTRVFERLSAL
jgi:xylulokinase